MGPEVALLYVTCLRNEWRCCWCVIVIVDCCEACRSCDPLAAVSLSGTVNRSEQWLLLSKNSGRLTN